MSICPHCRTSREDRQDRYCHMCGGDTLADARDVETLPPGKPEPDLSQLARYWEGDIAHWLREGASPASLRAVVESAITKAQAPRVDEDA